MKYWPIIRHVRYFLLLCELAQITLDGGYQPVSRLKTPPPRSGSGVKIPESQR